MGRYATRDAACLALSTAVALAPRLLTCVAVDLASAVMDGLVCARVASAGWAAVRQEDVIAKGGGGCDVVLGAADAVLATADVVAVAATAIAGAYALER